MILERAELSVRPGHEREFETALGQARQLIAASPGFLTLRLSRCLQRPSTYLLLVEWEQLTDHTEVFRGSAAYNQWRALLHPFYDPFPTVEHFVDVA